MAFAEPADRSEPTHAVRTRSRSGVSDWDDDGQLSVENRVVDVAMTYGDGVHLCLDRSLLERRAPGRLSTARERFERLPDDRRLFRTDSPEYRARLPEDAEAVRSCLALEPGDTDVWLARLHGIAALAVVTADSWLYRSVPHHAHIRELNADAADGLLADVAGELASIPGSGVVPTGALVAWSAAEYRYELTWNALRRRSPDGESDSWTAVDLDRLRGVRLVPERGEIRFRWGSQAETAASPFRRALASAVDRLTADPPTRVAVAGSETVAEIAAALRELRAQFGYEFAIDDRQSEG
ncbi:hypothetical protein C477_15695 [Haloterrigena salina JCM 13891]|uniref:Uncharacterized protein n=1 Tax=Haloterrigena salina JCM 13891 TaxID=1227488 RepID=M0C3L3_9EURY|nr:hypothetical protein [Haloterrigena salina]ELZ16489.1 hypothetical protein C477_15695 [Haloterrigena salina JCM 13891]